MSAYDPAPTAFDTRKTVLLTYSIHRRTLAAGALHAAGLGDFSPDPLARQPLRPEGPTLP